MCKWTQNLSFEQKSEKNIANFQFLQCKISVYFMGMFSQFTIPALKPISPHFEVALDDLETLYPPYRLRCWVLTLWSYCC